MEYDSLPTFEDCQMAVESMTADPVEVFIYENEPAGVDAIKFRKSFQEALYFFCVNKTRKEVGNG
jgi:hypothetical protein